MISQETSEEEDNDDNFLVSATPEESIEIEKLQVRSPNLYDSYLKYFQDGQREMLKIILSESGRKSILELKPQPEHSFLLRTIRMDPHTRSAYLRRIHIGYEAARLIGNDLTRKLFSLFRIGESEEGFDEECDEGGGGEGKNSVA